MHTREAYAKRHRQLAQAITAHRRSGAKRRAFYAVAAGILLGLAFLGFIA